MFQEQLLTIPLSDAELAQRKHELSELEIQMLRAGEELERAKEIHKSETKPLKVRKKDILLELRTGLVERKVNVMEVVDGDAGYVEYFDEKGEVVHKRKLTRGEQLNLTKQI